jgi:brefeldin A-inhibited guanine nucleotide-exchange protein 3
MKLHAAHVLTMDALLAVGLELGSHAPKCWKHVFRYLKTSGDSPLLMSAKIRHFGNDINTNFVFHPCRCCSYIAGLQNSQFLQDVSDPSSKVIEVPSPVSDASSLSDFVSADVSSDGSASDIIRQHHDTTPDTTQVLSSSDASRAIYALSTSVDRLFEHAANTLSSDAMVWMLESLAEASADQLDKSSAGVLSYDHQAVTHGNGQLSSNLHFCRMVDMLLRCTRDGKRPLLHLMRAWATISEHFVKVRK